MILAVVLKLSGIEALGKLHLLLIVEFGASR